MKRFCCVVFVSLVSQLVFSQPFANEQAIRRYLSTNITKLDPIEGVYDVTNVVEAMAGPYSKTTRENYTYAIYRLSESLYCIYDITNGDFCDTNMHIKRIGETQHYKMVLRHKTIEFTLDDLFSFSYSYNNSYYAARSTVSFSAIKEFPTRSMYEDAIRKVEEKFRREQAAKVEKQKEYATKSNGWTGTGFALRDGYVVTNYHVVEDANNITIQGIGGDLSAKFSATVVASDRINDIAILKISDHRFSGFGNIPYMLRSNISEVATEIFVLGYPLTSTMGEEIKYTTGVISSKTGFQGDVSQYQISAPVQPGNSGGPLFNSRGDVIGVVSAKHAGAENVGYAIKTSYLKSLVESILPANVLPSVNNIQNLAKTEKVKKLKPFIFLINCEADKFRDVMTTNGVLTIQEIRSTENIFSITFEYENHLTRGWMNIDKNAYIMVNGEKLKLTRANGIKIAPQRTYFDYPGQKKMFILYFPPIPQNAKYVDFIENTTSAWRIHNIQLK